MGLHVSCCPTEDWRWNSPSYCVSMEIFHFYLNWCVKCISHIPLRYHCSLCWYDRLLYELWIHDLCLNPSSTSQDVFYAETSRHSPPLVTRPRDNHLTTWRGVTSRVTAVTQPAVMRCLDRVTSPDHVKLSHTAEIHIWNVENYFDTTFVVNCFIRNRTSNTEIGRVLFQCYKSYFR